MPDPLHEVSMSSFPSLYMLIMLSSSGGSSLSDLAEFLWSVELGNVFELVQVNCQDSIPNAILIFASQPSSSSMYAGCHSTLHTGPESLKCASGTVTGATNIIHHPQNRQHLQSSIASSSKMPAVVLPQRLELSLHRLSDEL